MTWPNRDIRKITQILGAFWHFFWKQFFAANCMQSSAALAYTTLLSLVPLMVVSFSVFSAFPVFENASGQIQDFVFENFVPASGAIVQEHLSSFVSKAKRLTGTGIFFLMVTAIMMMSTIEKSLNNIWRLSQHRNLLNKFIIYWAVLTLGPLFMGVGIAITSYVVSLPLLAEPAVLIGKRMGLLKTIPFVMETLAFTFLYLLVPVTRVQFTHAVVGGLVAASLFELAKFGFTLYITNFPTYQTIYGALASVPIFLVWVYLSWTIALIGGQLAYSLSTFRYCTHQKDVIDSDNNLMMAIRILQSLWKAQTSGQALELECLIESTPEISMRSVQTILDILKTSHIVTQDENENWLLMRDLSQYKLSDLYRQHEFTIQLTEPQSPEDKVENAEMLKAFSQIGQNLDDSMDFPITRLFVESGSESI